MDADTEAPNPSPERRSPVFDADKVKHVCGFCQHFEADGVPFIGGDGCTMFKGMVFCDTRHMNPVLTMFAREMWGALMRLDNALWTEDPNGAVVRRIIYETTGLLHRIESVAETMTDHGDNDEDNDDFWRRFLPTYEPPTD